MRFARRVFGIPLHPLLVHFPIAFWMAVPALDVAALYAAPRSSPWWTSALGATALGLVIGAAALATGLLEYREPSVAGIDMRLAARHAVRTSLSWCVFSVKMLLVIAFLPASTWLIVLCLVLDLLGCILLVQGIYFGTRQVYEQLERE